jgi:hypothetical protein
VIASGLYAGIRFRLIPAYGVRKLSRHHQEGTLSWQPFNASVQSWIGPMPGMAIRRD